MKNFSKSKKSRIYVKVAFWALTALVAILFIGLFAVPESVTLGTIIFKVASVAAFFVAVKAWERLTNRFPSFIRKYS